MIDDNSVVDHDHVNDDKENITLNIRMMLIMMMP